MGVSKVLKLNYTVKLSPKKTKWTSLEVGTHPTFVETLISKYDFGPVKLPRRSTNGPLAFKLIQLQLSEYNVILLSLPK